MKEGIYKRIIEAKQRLEPIEEKIKQNSNDVIENKEFYNKRTNNIKEMYEQVMLLLEVLSEKEGNYEK